MPVMGINAYIIWFEKNKRPGHGPIFEAVLPCPYVARTALSGGPIFPNISEKLNNNLESWRIKSIFLLRIEVNGKALATLVLTLHIT